MRLRDPRAFVAAAMILGASVAAADPTGPFFYVTPTAGFTLFDGSIRFPAQPLKDAPYYGGRIGYQYLPNIGFEAAGGYSSTRENAPGGSDISFWHVSGNVTLSAFHGLYGNPFISLGGGLSKLTPKDGSVALTSEPGTPPGPVHQGNFEAAAGWNYWLSDRLALRVEGRDLNWLPKHHFSHILTHTVTSSVALTYTFGSKGRDTDGDGVPDRADRCPATPHGAVVDALGCPHDSDGDGVLDGLDQCPNTPKGCTIDGHGCPHDSDGDGVCDGLDKCPDTPKGATVDTDGCPHDADGDGVLDGLDQCPNTPKGAKVDDKGCPIDSDHDGVPDGLDQCPGTAAGVPVDSTGCAIGEREREQEMLDTGEIRLENVQFETGKADLRPESRPVIDVVGDLLSHWPDLRIEIGGHTDAKGSKKLNEKLSQARADSVRAYLLARFPMLDPTHFVAKGYGPTKPIASNDTEAGRALNRRVEFVVMNRGVLIQESQKRSQPGGTGTPGAPSLPSAAPSPGALPSPAPEAPSVAPPPSSSAPAPQAAPKPTPAPADSSRHVAPAAPDTTHHGQ